MKGHHSWPRARLGSISCTKALLFLSWWHHTSPGQDRMADWPAMLFPSSISDSAVLVTPDSPPSIRKGTKILKSSFTVSYKTKHILNIWTSKSYSLGFTQMSEKLTSMLKPALGMLKAALSVIAKPWEQPSGPSAHEWTICGTPRWWNILWC